MANRRSELAGNRYGRLTVEAFVGIKLPRHDSCWRCRCDCGGVVEVAGRCLASGTTKSCGCLVGRSNRKHGMSNTGTYESWHAMKARCTRASHHAYPNYGGRGITVCAEWMAFGGFLKDMGERPSGDYTIERIDNDKGYCKDNCRWASRDEQQRNRRSSVTAVVDGVRMCAAELARRHGLSRHVVADRINKGDDASAATRPVSRGRMVEFNGEVLSISGWSRRTGVCRKRIAKQLTAGVPVSQIVGN